MRGANMERCHGWARAILAFGLVLLGHYGSSMSFSQLRPSCRTPLAAQRPFAGRCKPLPRLSLEKAAVPLMVDYGSVALGLFNNLRTTSALLTGASLGSLYGSPAVAKGSRWPRMQHTASSLYMLGMGITVAHNFLVVFLCTIGTTAILTGSRVTHATSAKELLMGPFLLEYLTCRVFFLGSLCAFLFALACKTFVMTASAENPRPAKDYLGFSVTSLLMLVAFSQLAYTNHMVAANHGSLGLMYLRVVSLWLTRYNPLTGVCSCLQCAAFAATLIFMLLSLTKAIFPGTESKTNEQ
mmetsp:Transcript_15259/g.33513  ORF Transcript_15259/g.33513 Transcript_15259/m.33513 type:complete len:297 (-) Transcript_15259:231-1121(-)